MKEGKRGRRVSEILERKAQKTVRIRTTFYLEEKGFRWFQDFCSRRDATPSEMIERWIADLREEIET